MYVLWVEEREATTVTVVAMVIVFGRRIRGKTGVKGDMMRVCVRWAMGVCVLVRVCLCSRVLCAGKGKEPPL